MIKYEEVVCTCCATCPRCNFTGKCIQAFPVEDVELRLVDATNNGEYAWYTIERADHDHKVWLERTGPTSSALRYSGRLGNADVEGTGEEMCSIAEAIRSRKSVEFRRCAVEVFADGSVALWSPRNSVERGFVTLARADHLADQIEAVLGKDTALPNGD